MRSVRISRRTAQALLDAATSGQILRVGAVMELQAALASKPKPSSTSYAKQKRKKKASKREETAEIGYRSEASRARARLEAQELISQAEKVSGGGG